MKLNGKWITGFVDGEDCFHVAVNKHGDMRCGFQVLPEFTVVQHERDVRVLHALKEYFGCGVVRRNHGDRMSYRVRARRDLVLRIVPFFEKHPLKTIKREEFSEFKRVLQSMEAGDHLTKDGVEEIRRIAARMNRGRLR